MSKRTRLKPEDRKRVVLNAAVEVALEKGVFKFSIANVSRHLPGTSKSTIKHYFTMEELRTAVITDALERPDCLLIVAQAVAMRHHAVSHLSETDRAEYLKHV